MGARPRLLLDLARARPFRFLWIYTIARNLRIYPALRGDKRASFCCALARWSSRKRRSVRINALNATERDALLRSALKELSQEQVRVLQLSSFCSRAHGDIAALLDLPLGHGFAAGNRLAPVRFTPTAR